MTPPTVRPSPDRILAALERQPGAWVRTGPRSIEHGGLAVRLTLGIVSIHVEHIGPGNDPMPIKVMPAMRARMAELLEDRLRSTTGADLDPDDMARGANDIA
jgi:hypothetical protein